MLNIKSQQLVSLLLLPLFLNTPRDTGVQGRLDRHIVHQAFIVGAGMLLEVGNEGVLLELERVLVTQELLEPLFLNEAIAVDVQGPDFSPDA